MRRIAARSASGNNPWMAGRYLLMSAWRILSKTVVLVLYARVYDSVSFRIVHPARMSCVKSPRAFPHGTIHGVVELFIEACDMGA